MSQEESPRRFAVQRFKNEPATDFSRAANRDEMKQALGDVRGQFGDDFPLMIGGKAIDTRNHLVIRNPSKKSETLGKVASATADHAAQGVDAARRAWKAWRKTSVNDRAEYLELIAAEMRNRRFELTAWMVYECGKPWREADAEVAEAIDFCLYYALAARDLETVISCDYPGEQNRYRYLPRGVAVIIAPWNFPLAILTGMTAAALVTGNTVVIKPAEQASITGAKFAQLTRDAGLPAGVLTFLPGVGSDVGQALVESPEVDLIAFTGSRDVGLSIYRTATDTRPQQLSVKKVLAEMGGKNSIIIDEDADVDDAVQGVLASAFGYAGQKCSACSRLIVLDSVHDAFVERLKAAVESLRVGAAEEPGVDLGPLIDQDAQSRVQDYIAIGKEECVLAAAVDVGKLAQQGWFVGPHVYTNVAPDSRLAQDEIFGPLLAVIRARHLDEAFAIANGTDYALTGGIYSRSPKNLARAQQELYVGNLYLNRGITGAVVQRQPFGGFRMSGIGSKAGGPDYLQEFMLPMTITENTMRRGFAPQDDGE